MQSHSDAYLDIETTGLYPGSCTITVAGIYIDGGAGGHLVQLIEDDITIDALVGALEGIGTIYTYNGSRFDLPFINSQLGLNLAQLFEHHDLMYRCWKNNLYGGFKAVERHLGIERKLTELDGYQAVRLWWRYLNDYDQDALATLLEYNREDVVNLKTLKERLL